MAFLDMEDFFAWLPRQALDILPCFWEFPVSLLCMAFGLYLGFLSPFVVKMVPWASSIAFLVAP